MPAETFDDLDARLKAEGWQRGIPRTRGLVDGVSIDREVAEEAECEECGQKGLLFVSYVDPDRQISTSGYCCVAQCPQCNASFEF